MSIANLKRVIAAGILLGASTASSALTCSASVGTLAFGNYNGVSGLPTDSQNTLTVTCSSLLSILVSYTVSLSAGNSGNTAARQLRQSSNSLNYNLFKDILRTNVWGTGANAVSDSYLLSILGIGVDRTYPIYGRIAASQSSAPSGSYSDTITVTVAY